MIICKFYKLFLKKIDAIQEESLVKKLGMVTFPCSKFSSFFNYVNVFNGTNFSNYTVDDNSFDKFTQEQNKISDFIKSLLETMEIIDSGPGYHFIYSFCKLLRLFKLSSVDGTTCFSLAIFGGRVLVETDELPASFPNLRREAAQLSRPPNPAGGVWNGVPVRAVG